MARGGADETKLENTPTWIVALVCTVIVFISLVAERSLHRLGKRLKEKKLKSLYEALLKIKEELMLLGFISLLLMVFQGTLVKICVSPDIMKHMLPCDKGADNAAYVAHIGGDVTGSRRRLLAGGGYGSGYCADKGKASLLSVKAIHDLHIFIFVLAVTHVIISAITLRLAFLRINQWKQFEESLQKEAAEHNEEDAVIPVQDAKFIQRHYTDGSEVKAWLLSFAKQFYASVTKHDYQIMRLGFIRRNCGANSKFDFYKYIIRVLEADFNIVVGISWYLWIYVFLFLLLNIDGWHLYFWFALIPFALLLAVGAESEHVILRLAQGVADKNAIVRGQVVVELSDRHFSVGRPDVLLYLLHFILFQNAFELAYFFWIWIKYGLHSCMMGPNGYLIPRLIIGAVSQIIFSYSTLPLYAIVTQMGSFYKKEIFEKRVQATITAWAKKVKSKGGEGTSANARSPASRAGDVLLQNMAGQTEINIEPSSTAH